jgi:hypothetical protein
LTPLVAIRAEGFSVRLDDVGRVLVQPASALTEERRAWIASHKAELLAELEREREQAAPLRFDDGLSPIVCQHPRIKCVRCGGDGCAWCNGTGRLMLRGRTEDRAARALATADGLEPTAQRRRVLEYRFNDDEPGVWHVTLSRPADSLEAAVAALRRQFPDVVDVRERDTMWAGFPFNQTTEEKVSSHYFDAATPEFDLLVSSVRLPK